VTTCPVSGASFPACVVVVSAAPCFGSFESPDPQAAAAAKLVTAKTVTAKPETAVDKIGWWRRIGEGAYVQPS
jgi:hypothetical protein